MLLKGQDIVRVNNHDVKFNYRFEEDKKVISFIGMKTKSQRKFRDTEDFYNEINNIKVKQNTFDDLFDQFYNKQKSDEEIIKERQHREDLTLEILNIDKEELYQLVNENIKENVLKIFK